MSRPLEAHPEHHALERRCWVRLTQVCNNRCLFCHDSGLQDGRIGDVEALNEEIRRGRAVDAQRLILSGGEPTVHPRFLDFVALGKSVGYRWVQAVSNGRMFAYPGFVHRALEAGLDEVTLSMHGHSAALHDGLTGVTGGFGQSLRGLDQLLASGRCVVSVDVVLTARNLPVLPELIRFYLDRGVREFDLLWLVPFGRAWEHRATLFVDSTEQPQTLREAVRLCREAGAVVWTNRLPPALLEGCEDLIQEPDKILDEVRGRSLDFGRWLEAGTDMPCRDEERCSHCFMRGYCSDLECAIKALRQGGLDAVLLEVGDAPAGWAGTVSRAATITIRAATIDAAAEVARQLPAAGQNLVAWVDHAPSGDPASLDWGATHRLVRVGSRSPACLQSLLAGSAVSVEVLVGEEMAGWLPAAAKFLGPRADTVSIAWEPAWLPQESPARILAPLAPLRVGLRDLPLCLLPAGLAAQGEMPIDAHVFPASGGLDLQAFSEHFLRHRYRVFSTRCADCARRHACPGLSIHWARRYGFGILRPKRAQPRSSA